MYSAELLMVAVNSIEDRRLVELAWFEEEEAAFALRKSKDLRMLLEWVDETTGRCRYSPSLNHLDIEMEGKIVRFVPRLEVVGEATAERPAHPPESMSGIPGV